MVFAARIQSGFARADGVEISDVGWFDTSQLSRLMECGQVVRGRVLKAILRDAARIGSIQLERTNALAAA
jgi:NADH pyrophosphatase NudC (nudix superfamily)